MFGVYLCGVNKRFIHTFEAPLLLLIGIAATGCAKHSTPQAKGSPKPSATPTPLNIAAHGNDIDTTLFDNSGHIVVQIHAAAAAANPTIARNSSDVIGLASTATAKLYQAGKPTALLTAKTLQADRDTRILTATGDVVVHSLSASDGPMDIQADTMTWSYNQNLIQGSGHVVVQRGDLIRLPGQSFTANTQLKNFTLNGKPTASAVP